MDLQNILKEELKTMYGVMQSMNPTSEAEFIAVALPNLHIRMHELLQEDNYPNKGKHRLLCFFDTWEDCREIINKLPDEVETAYIAVK